MTKLITILVLAGGSLLATTRYISPTGSDSNPCTTSARCKSINAAFQLSTNGDIILAQSGTYSDVQEIRNNKMTGSLTQTPIASNVVTVMPESGTVTFSAEVHLSDSVTGTPVQHLTFQNVTFAGFLWIRSGQDIHFTGVHFADLSQWGCSTYVSLQNSEVGPFTTSYGDGIDLYGQAYNSCNFTPGNWLIETSTIHGISTNESTAHPDAIALDDGDTVVIRRNKFYNNCGDDLRISAQGPPRNILLQNNYFGPPVSCAAGAATTVQVVDVGTVVSYNTFDGWVQLGSPTTLFDNQLWEGNIITGMVGSGCPIGSGTIARYNVWSTQNSANCGTNNVRVSSFGGWFLDSSITAGIYDLTALASAAIGAGNPSSYPAVDINGNPRPAKPDAGAYQYSGLGGGTVTTQPNPPSNLVSNVR
jgi:hypothetical protein